MHFSVTSFFKIASFRFLSMQLSIYLLLPCDTKFLREFIFADWRFFVFDGNQEIFVIRADWFFSLGFNFFAIFRKYPVPSINNIFVFVKYIEIHISFPNTTTVCVLYVKPAIQCPRRDFAQRRNPEEAP